MNAIGIFGGSFDPIHNQHLEVALQALKQFTLAEVQFIVAKQSPLKNVSYATASDRYKMVQQAIAGYPKFVANDLELHREQLSYTAATIKWFQQRYPKQKLAFIMGADCLHSVKSWPDFDKVMDQINIIVAPRLNVPYPDWFKPAPISDFANHTGQFFLLDLPAKADASTEIRQLLRLPNDHSSLVQYLPHPALTYILEHHLYEQ